MRDCDEVGGGEGRLPELGEGAQGQGIGVEVERAGDAERQGEAVEVVADEVGRLQQRGLGGGGLAEGPEGVLERGLEGVEGEDVPARRDPRSNGDTRSRRK